MLLFSLFVNIDVTANINLFEVESLLLNKTDQALCSCVAPTVWAEESQVLAD